MMTTSTDPRAPGLLMTSQVAALFRVASKTVNRRAEAGRIRAVRTPGGHRRFFAADVPPSSTPSLMTGRLPDPADSDVRSAVPSVACTGGQRLCRRAGVAAAMSCGKSCFSSARTCARTSEISAVTIRE